MYIYINIHIDMIYTHIHNIYCIQDYIYSDVKFMFSSFCSVVIIIDLSTSNKSYLVHIQHSLRLLMEQQMANKEYFNIIT